MKEPHMFFGTLFAQLAREIADNCARGLAWVLRICSDDYVPRARLLNSLFINKAYQR